MILCRDCSFAVPADEPGFHLGAPPEKLRCCVNPPQVFPTPGGAKWAFPLTLPTDGCACGKLKTHSDVMTVISEDVRIPEETFKKMLESHAPSEEELVRATKRLSALARENPEPPKSRRTRKKKV